MRLFLFELLSDPGNSIHAKALRNQILFAWGARHPDPPIEISNAFDALNLVNSIKALKLVNSFRELFRNMIYIFKKKLHCSNEFLLKSVVTSWNVLFILVAQLRTLKMQIWFPGKI